MGRKTAGAGWWPGTGAVNTLAMLAHRLRYRLACLPRSPRQADRLLLLHGTLRRVGWSRSVSAGSPVTALGSPLPWLTYPAIHWLHGALRGDERVFEFGSGGSTLWLAARVASVDSVEHDVGWYDRMRARVPGNVSVSLVAHPGYPDSILGRGPFDLVVVDGVDRPASIDSAVGELGVDGAIVVDNSDRSELHAPMAYLEAAGFARIDFAGPAPALTNFSCTSVLSRSLDRWASRRPPLAWGTAHALGGVVDPLVDGAWGA